MLNDRFYESAGKYSYEKSFDRYHVPQEDRALIKEYLDEKEAMSHIGPARVRKIGFTLIGWSRFIKKPWAEVTVKEVLAGINLMKKAKAIRFGRNGKIHEGATLSSESQYDFVAIMKPFLLWLIENKKNAALVEREVTKKIKPPTRRDPAERIDPKSLPTVEEIRKIIDSTLTVRDRALLNVLYESGARSGEIARLTWNDVEIDEYGVKLYIVDTKAIPPKKRYSRLTESNASLSTLRGLHPNPTGDNFIFINDDGTPLSYVGMRRVLERALARSDIDKKLSLHTLRHCRATHMVQANYNPEIIKKSLWGNLNTKMFQTYVSLGERDIDNEFLGKAGVTPLEQKAPPKPRVCGNCHYVNEIGAKFCSRCGMPLEEKAAKNLKEAEVEAELLPEYKALLEEFNEKLLAMQKAALKK